MITFNRLSDRTKSKLRKNIIIYFIVFLKMIQKTVIHEFHRGSESIGFILVCNKIKLLN